MDGSAEACCLYEPTQRRSTYVHAVSFNGSTSNSGKRAVYFLVSVQAHTSLTLLLVHSAPHTLYVSVCLSSVVMASKARSLESTPTLPELLNFQTASGEDINIISEIGTDFKKLGPQILIDKRGAVLAGIVSKNINDADSINQEILTKWIRGRGKKPVAWSTLIDLLKVIGLSELAETIEADLTGSGEILKAIPMHANCLEWYDEDIYVFCN